MTSTLYHTPFPTPDTLAAKSKNITIAYCTMWDEGSTYTAGKCIPMNFKLYTVDAFAIGVSHFQNLYSLGTLSLSLSLSLLHTHTLSLSISLSLSLSLSLYQILSAINGRSCPRKAYHIYQPLRSGRIWHKVNF